ncbi:hypothetical protein HBH92_148710 [Parastagonospora nodorum]|nr:hypothetical protein HBH92_148710 [Parastagonospora nodorum]KAH4435749.1 hypothetical protein HBH93_114450 [Parastagonospora nodorum]KAH4447297.1 hypothetical protein HBH91_134610 [Parastagonospora nodorum]KAH4505328.1 hypothetical protein HBH89_087640 [Parastagonospora nodorum]KAH4536889.1 hypothetical protein HBH85_153190 [Parastagonospora nodorum]
MCDSTFAFGQRGSHVFQCPSRREIARLPTKLSTLLSSAQLHRVYHVALGFEDSFLITWSDKSGDDHVDSHSLPLELREFLYARNSQKRLVRNIPEIRCSLGSYNSSFFAHDGSTYRWMNLPPSLLLALQSRIEDGNWTDRPRLVSLGANDNFVLVTEKNAAIWNLQNYKTMANLLDFSKTQDRGILEIRNIVLHAHRYGCFITQSRNGSLIHENIPPHSLPGLEAMCAPILQDTKELEAKMPLRRESDMRHSLPRRPSRLQGHAVLHREWNEHSQQFTAKAKGVKLSLRLSVSMNGMAKLMR